MTTGERVWRNLFPKEEPKPMQRAKVARTIDREEERAQKVLERISDKLGLK